MHEVYFNIPLGVGPASDYSIWRANSYLGLTSSCGPTPMKWGKTRGVWDSKPAQTETSLIWTSTLSCSVPPPLKIVPLTGVAFQ